MSPQRPFDSSAFCLRDTVTSWSWPLLSDAIFSQDTYEEVFFAEAVTDGSDASHESIVIVSVTHESHISHESPISHESQIAHESHEGYS